MRRSSQKQLQKLLDQWFPTLIRYAGVGIGAYALVENRPSFLTLALGGIFFKTIYGRRNGHNNG